MADKDVMNQAKRKGNWLVGQWLAENSVEDSDVALMAKKNAIKEFNITEHEASTFYVTILCTWRPELLHLSTRRVKTEPRMFKNLDRLTTHIKEQYPTIRQIHVTLNRRREDPAMYEHEDRRGQKSPAVLHSDSA